MTWEYLDTPELDGRFLIASGYLSNRIKGKFIVDLNCGTARLLNYLPKDYAGYYCNDKVTYNSRLGLTVNFQQITDLEMVKYLESRKVNILCVFGHGGGDKLPNGHESKTLSQSANYLIGKHRPEIVILEANYTYVKKYEVLKDIIYRATIEYAYTIKQNIIVKPANSTDPLSERNIIILERGENIK